MKVAQCPCTSPYCISSHRAYSNILTVLDMAVTAPLFTTSLLLLSLLVIATANDYNYDSSKNQAYNYGTKPEGEEKPEHGTKPELYKPQPEDKEKPVDSEKTDYGRKRIYQTQPEKPESGKEEKPDYGRKPVYQPQPEKPESEKEEKPDNGTKQNFYKPQPEEKEKPESEEEEKPDYSTKPDFYKPQPEENKKPESSDEVEKPNYSAKPDSYEPKSEEKEESSYGGKPYVAKPKPEGEENADHYGIEVPDLYPLKPEILPIGVQGLVLCKSGPKYNPIQGALVRITCLAVDENGYEKSHSVCRGETDAKGYFFAPLSPLGLDDHSQLKLTECKAFLESSPSETCNVPVDVNKGLGGAPLSDFRVLNQKRMKLYSVGPFFFTDEANSVSNGY
ncbi:proline-rich protein 3-like [Herrania umbratica]|uniref:Proline-rich protein 3-like n=1 Tax=Herrania umbratica TaxID=108875 RepID=A0A6J1A2Z3_9ROSI|nr:proline-rich protein 3-like [Herrania umbratica]